MNQKRKTLKKAAGISAAVTLAPSSWSKPIANSVFLPAHAQTSNNQAPTISGISCKMNTPTLQLGSSITIEATIEDADTPIADISWKLNSSTRGVVSSGEGQFTSNGYLFDLLDTVTQVNDFVLELEVFDGAGNTTVATLCDEKVPTPRKITVADLSCSFDTPRLRVGSVITMEATFNVEGGPITDAVWQILKNGAPIVYGEGQFTTTTYTIGMFDSGNLQLALQFSAHGSRSELPSYALLCNDVIESDTFVTEITGPSTIESQSSHDYSIIADDADGLSNVSASIDSNDLNVAVSGGTYTVSLPNDLTLGVHTLEFVVTGLNSDSTNDASIVRSLTITVT